jgi:hypothetical protein
MTAFATATITSCPDAQICLTQSTDLGLLRSSNGNTPRSSSQSTDTKSYPSQTSSGGCTSTISGSLCYTCALTPTVIASSCVPVSSSTLSTSSSSISSAAGPKSTPNCPVEIPGRVFSDYLGGIYGIYCGLEIYNTNLGEPLRQESFPHCISACDAWNIVHFSEASPCRAVSYYETALDANCFLKTGTNYSTARLGVDSVKLLNPQLSENSASTSVVTVTTTVYSGTGGNGLSGVTTIISGSAGGGGLGTGE